MKFSKLDLLTLLISLFLFSSCKDSSTVGLDINPADAITGTLLDTVSITSRTLADDAVNTNGITAYPLGQMRDDIFGTTDASLAMAVNIFPTANKADKRIDSAVLVLPFKFTTLAAAREFYGDSTSVFTITVSQLNAPVYNQTTWLSNKVYAGGEVLGTFSGALKPNTPVPVTQIISGAPDTIAKQVPQLRIKLNSALIKSKILNLDSLILNNNTRFNDNFRGLKVTATTTGKNGGVMFLDFSGANSNLEIYYKQNNITTSTTIDTVFAKYPVITSSNAVAATVVHDYTNTPVAAQIGTPGEYQVTYLQAMSGLKNKISFPYIKDLKAKVGSKMIVSKAELVIDSSDPADSIPFKIAPRLAMYRLDDAKQRVMIPDNNPYSSTNTTGDIRAANSNSVIHFDGSYNKITKKYTFVFTHFIQDLIDGKVSNSDVYLAPTSYTTASTLYPYAYPVATSGGRTVIGSFNNTSNKKIRLNIYYVKATN